MRRRLSIRNLQDVYKRQDHDHFYYKEKKLSFTKTEDVYKRSLQAAKKGKTLTFHWRGGYLTREVLNELLGLIRKAGEEKNKTAVVNINWPQAVLRLYYTEAQICLLYTSRHLSVKPPSR